MHDRQDHDARIPCCGSRRCTANPPIERRAREKTSGRGPTSCRAKFGEVGVTMAEENPGVSSRHCTRASSSRTSIQVSRGLLSMARGGRRSFSRRSGNFSQAALLQFVQFCGVTGWRPQRQQLEASAADGHGVADSFVEAQLGNAAACSREARCAVSCKNLIIYPPIASRNVSILYSTIPGR